MKDERGKMKEERRMKKNMKYTKKMKKVTLIHFDKNDE